MKKSLLLLTLLLFFCPLLLSAAPASPYIISVTNQHQEGASGELTEKPFIVKVTDKKGNPLQGFRVESTCLNFDKKTKLITPYTTTGKNGVAKIFFKNGNKIKLYKIISRVYTPTGYKPLKKIKFSSMAVNFWGIFFYVLGGLALFLFGMKLLSDGLQTSAGDKMKSVLEFLSKNRFMGVLVGFLVTAVLQSSSVTTVMLIGFVNAGIMAFTQTIGIILGANIGTTITGFIISMKASAIAYPILIFGFLFFFLGKSNRLKYFGQIFIGLGLVFIGMKTMGANLKPLKDSISVSHFFVQFSRQPILAVVAGMMVTFIIQSSSATLGIIITLGSCGLITIPGAFALVLGSNIGTTITAQLAAIGANINARRVAMTHSIFNIFGCAIMLLLIQLGSLDFFYKFTASITNLVSSADVSWQAGKLVSASSAGPKFFIATSHALFNIANTLLFLPFVVPLGKLVKKIFPGKVERKYQYLEPHLIDTPAIALSQTVNELSYMLTTAHKLVDSASEGLFSESKKWYAKFEKRERKVDSLQHDITEYLVKISQRQMTAQEAERIPKLIHAVNDIERIGDLSENIMETALECREKKILFSAEAREELTHMQEEISKMIGLTLEALKHMEKEPAEKVLQQEELLNKIDIKLREQHIARLKDGKCKVINGIYFLEIIANFERIGDHLTNVAQVVIASSSH